MASGDESASSGLEMGIIFARDLSNEAVRSKILGWPTTTARQSSCIAGCDQAPTIVSGPTPVGSPCVMARSGLGIVASGGCGMGSGE